MSAVLSEQIENASGIWPMEYKVLVMPDDIHETDETYKRARAVGLELIEQVSEREQMAQVDGVLVAVGGNAFEGWNGHPKVGDRVLIGKYVGMIRKGADGKEYRLCNDKDIAAVLA